MSTRRLIAAVPIVALTAGLASAAPAKQGGIFRMGTTGASVQIDPQLSYVSTGWWLEYATAAKLYNYPDKRGQAGLLLRPEVASGYTVSGDGRTYTFTIRKGFRFSDGSPVTAKNFAYAIKRAKDPVLNSPAAAFIDQVGSAAAKGNKLVIRLTAPDPLLLTKLAMPFFQATSLKLPPTTEVTTGYPSAGPYYFARNDVDLLTSLRRNPYWKGSRPRHLAGVDIHWNMSEQDAFQQTLANRLDEGPIPAGEVQNVAGRFGVNERRFWVKPSGCVSEIVFNMQNGILAGNAPMRRAINWALDRTDYLPGNYTATPWTHLLTPLTPGAVTARAKQPYSVHSNIAKARKLAAGHFGDGRIKVAYRSSANPHQADVVRSALISLGFDPAKVEMKGFSGADIYTAIGVRGQPYDLFVSIGWCSDVPDAAGYFRGLLAAANVHTYDQKLAAVMRLPANKRAKALGRLDIQIMKTVAPLAPMGYYNNRFFLSNRVDPRSLVYQPTIQDWSIPALALK